MDHAPQQLRTQLPHLKFREAADFVGHDSGFHPDNLQAELMALPIDSQQVAELLQTCNNSGISVVTQGGRSGLAGAAATNAQQLILDTRQLNTIIDIDPTGGSVVVESGVALETLEQAVNKHGLSCGIDLAARGSATIGGMVATNAGGIEAFRNGIMRHHVLGLEVVLADGRIISDLKRVTKANEGYDIKQLFIGAEGTLGVITKIVLALSPKQKQSSTTLVSCKNAAQAVTLFRQLHNDQQLQLLSAEIMWPEYAHGVAKALKLENMLAFDESGGNVFVLLEIADNSAVPLENTLAKLLEQDMITDALLAKNERERDAIWRIREDSAVIDTLYPHGLWFDMSVPLGHLATYTDSLFQQISQIAPDLKLFLFAHLGDGNLHATISTGYPIGHLETAIKAAVYQGLPEIGGSFSAEHGIGIEKRDALAEYTPSENLAMMHEIKQLFDPNGIMNPGKVL